jgi:hypothetical protein
MNPEEVAIKTVIKLYISSGGSDPIAVVIIMING